MSWKIQIKEGKDYIECLMKATKKLKKVYTFSYRLEKNYRWN